MKKLIVVAVFALAACGGLATPRPVSEGGLSDRLVYLYGIQGATRGALADGILQGRISRDRGRELNDRLDVVRKDLDTALLLRDVRRVEALEGVMKVLEQEINHAQ